MLWDVETRQLSAFVAVADAGNFSRAADELGAGQPAVSQLIRRLEQDLGFRLFERSSHRVTITPAGSTLLPQARQALNELKRTRRLAVELAAGAKGSIRVGTMDGLADRLAPLLTAFRLTHSGIGVHLERVGVQERLARVLDGRLEVAFARRPPKIPGLTAFELWRDPLVCVLAEDHPLADLPVIDVGALAAFPTIAPARERHPWVHDAFVAMCLRAGFSPILADPYTDVQDAIAAAASSQAWVLLAVTSAPEHDGHGVVVRPLSHPDAVAPVSVACRATAPTTEATAFVAVAQAFAEAAGSHQSSRSKQPLP